MLKIMYAKKRYAKNTYGPKCQNTHGPKLWLLDTWAWATARQQKTGGVFDARENRGRWTALLQV